MSINSYYLSLPSDSINISNMPEISNLTTTFNYNYYTVDETAPITAYVSTTIPGSTIIPLAEGTPDNERRRAEAEYQPPRSVTISFNPAVVHTVGADIFATEGEFTTILPDGIPTISEAGSSGIIFAEAWANSGYTNVSLQDTNPEGSLYDIIDGTLPVLAADGTVGNISMGADSIGASSTGELWGAIAVDTYNFMFTTGNDLDTVLSLIDGSTTELSAMDTRIWADDGVTKNLIASVLGAGGTGNYQDIGWLTGFSPTMEGIRNSQLAALDPIKHLLHNSIVKDTVVYDIYRASAQEAFGVFSNDYVTSTSGEGSWLTQFEGIQASARSKALTSSPSEISFADHYSSIGDSFVLRWTSKAEPTEGHDNFEPIKWGIAGYIIDKLEAKSDGTYAKKTSLISEIRQGSSTQIAAPTIVDTDITYGSTYRYRVRSVCYVEMDGARLVSEEDDPSMPIEYGRAGFYLVSRGSDFSLVECIELEPPPPPQDVEFLYDYVAKNLIVHWKFPVHPPNDIKKFQVFRRRDLDMDGDGILDTSAYDSPFYLLRVIDFNDTVSPIESVESLAIPSSLKKKYLTSTGLGAPVTRYIDSEFTKDSRHIYAICSVDARGLSSNYSAQFEVSFDRYKNKIRVEYISPSGAPKPYPNIFLRRKYDSFRQDFISQEAFLDTIKVSGYSKMQLLFDADFLSVTKSEADDSKTAGTFDVNLLATHESEPTYKMTLLNIDNNGHNILNIRLDDKRDEATDVPVETGYSEWAIEVLPSVLP